MTSRELVIKTLNQQPIPRIPRDLWTPQDSGASDSDEIAELNLRFPSDILHVELVAPAFPKSAAKAGHAPEWEDSWGCTWRRDDEGELVQSGAVPLTDHAKLTAFTPPAELLSAARFNKINKACQGSNRFVLGWSETRPFDRLRALRGKEQALVDLARSTKAIRALLAALHDFARRELEAWAKTEVDGVVFRDNWASAEGMLIAPEMWREMFRPLYREYCEILHAEDKFVFFHSAGNITEIFSDLIKTGIDAIHAQLHLMDATRLAKRYRGRVTFWGEGDRQWMREPGALDEFRQSVLAIRKVLDFGSGGVIAQCQWGPGVRLQTVAAFFEQWLTSLPMHA